MIVTSADQVRPHVQTVTTYAADFDEVQLIELDADDVDEWQYAYTDVERTVYESQVRIELGLSTSYEKVLSYVPMWQNRLIECSHRLYTLLAFRCVCEYDVGFRPSHGIYTKRIY